MLCRSLVVRAYLRWSLRFMRRAVCKVFAKVAKQGSRRVGSLRTPRTTSVALILAELPHIPLMTLARRARVVEASGRLQRVG